MNGMDIVACVCVILGIAVTLDHLNRNRHANRSALMLYDKKWDLDQTDIDIINAAVIIQTGGLCKKKLWEKAGTEHCMNGALIVAIAGERIYATDKHRERILSAQQRIIKRNNLPFATGWEGTTIANWNNRPERTAQEVVDAMNYAVRAKEIA